MFVRIKKLMNGTLNKKDEERIVACTNTELDEINQETDKSISLYKERTHKLKICAVTTGVFATSLFSGTGIHDVVNNVFFEGKPKQNEKIICCTLYTVAGLFSILSKTSGTAGFYTFRKLKRHQQMKELIQQELSHRLQQTK